jgi:hypothetical protein
MVNWVPLVLLPAAITVGFPDIVIGKPTLAA